MITKNRNLGRYLRDNNIPAISVWAGHEQVLVGHELSGYKSKIVAYEQTQTGSDESGEPIIVDGDPIYGDDYTKPIYNGDPIYEDGDELFRLEWIGEPGVSPTEEELAAFDPPPPPPPNPVTDVEKIFLTVSDRLNSDEAKRTGKSIDPKGAVPLSRAMAATAMLYGRWSYPTEADLSTGNNPAILAAIYADPTTKTNAESSVEQKCKVLQFTLVMLAGQQFGLDYQAELGAYERTASGAFLSKLAEDQRDWLKLPCPKMHKDWPEFKSVLEMFQTLMK